jgi:BirA family biotin operon repressor/biotin-[acetyl-CoA-carboxylase] ligase
VSPPGKNLYASIILRPDLPPHRASELTLLASVALCEVLRETGAEAVIKWPNDLLVGGKKVAGILTEMAADPDRVQWVVVGLGVNLNVGPGDLPEDLRDEATSVAVARGSSVPRALFAAALLARLEAWLDRHAAEGFAPVRAAWRALSGTLGREVRVVTGEGDVTGVAFDVDETGALLVRGPAGVTRILAGDVHLLRPR